MHADRKKSDLHMMDGIPQKTFVNEVWKYTIVTEQVHVLTHFQYTMYYRYSKSDLILAFIWTKCQQDMIKNIEFYGFTTAL